MTARTVFFLSDGTGITAEAFGNAILTQFDIAVRRVRLPFVDTPDKAHQALRQINHVCETEGQRPLVFARPSSTAFLTRALVFFHRFHKVFESASRSIP